MSSFCKTKQSPFSEHCFQGQMLWWLEREKMQLYIIPLGEGQIGSLGFKTKVKGKESDQVLGTEKFTSTSNIPMD